MGTGIVLEPIMIRSHICICLCLSTSLALGQGTASSTSALQAIQLQAWSALVSTALPTTLALDGTFTSTEGSLTQNGNVHLTVGSDGSFLTNLPGAVGAVSESRTIADGLPACTWTDQNGVVHNGLFLNCVVPAWFFPGLTLLSSSSTSSLAAWTPSSISTDSLGEHLRFQFAVPGLNVSPANPLLSQSFDLVLAPDTHLPLYSIFTNHPDNGSVLTDIAVKIAYSNYQNISGVMIPFHIQRFVNNSLALDITIASASVQ
jgi:hypothetical protein